MSDHQLDARRLLCPMPVIKTQDKIKQLKVGERLTVFSTDPGALHDIPSWCRVNGHQVETAAEIDHEIVVTILVGE